MLAIPNPIEWHDGMLLSPQHFDDLTLRLEGLLEQASVLASPFNWGVSSLEIGEAELLDGMVSVNLLEAILPDGFPVWHSGGGDVTLQLALESLDASFKAGVFTIYAAVPAHREGAGRLWRFEPSPGTRQEQIEAEAEESTPIPRLRPRLQLIAAAGPLPSRYTGLPLTRLQFRNGAFARVGPFLPPTQKLRLDSPLTGQCVTLLRRVREAAILLQQQYRSLSAAEREGQDLARRTAVQQLVAMLPYAEGILEVGEVHPFQIFLTLCTLAGHVASISSDPIPPNFAPYNHLDMVGSFTQVTTFIEKILAENTSEDYVGIPFQHGEDSFYLIFEPGWKGRKLVLAMHGPETAPAELLSWGEHALIGSSIIQDSMRGRRILGARRMHIERERGLIAGQGTMLFELANDDEYIHGGEMLEVSGAAASAGKPSEITLYVMLT